MEEKQLINVVHAINLKTEKICAVCFTFRPETLPGDLSTKTEEY
jgi:hypothetical protein